MSSTLLCGALNLCIPARNAVDLNGGKASCRMSARQSTVANAFRGWGCSDRDAALSINMALCAAFPCMAIFWRRCDIHPIVISGSRSLFRGGSRANISIFTDCLRMMRAKSSAPSSLLCMHIAPARRGGSKASALPMVERHFRVI